MYPHEPPSRQHRFFTFMMEKELEKKNTNNQLTKKKNN